MESNTPVPLLSTSSRPLANFHPSVWGDRFLHLHESNHNNHVLEEDQMIEQLKEEVKWMLKKVTSKDYVEQLEIVDAIQRLGIAYHFGEEIDQVLQIVFEKFDDYCLSSLNLHIVALSFRLLRQHGYRVSSEVFQKFKDAKGDWIVPKSEAVKGMLELFEAIHLRVHNEDVLDSGFVLSKDYLDLVLHSLESPYDELVLYALKHNSQRRGVPRAKARHYISVYEKFSSHNQDLLRLAKLDFNQLQCMHKKELSEIYSNFILKTETDFEVGVLSHSLHNLDAAHQVYLWHANSNNVRWWKDLDVVTNFPYARDRLVEVYLCIVEVFFEPKYALARRFLCKALALISVVDDTFDAYGTFEELKLFNEAIQRWDISSLDELPDYMKVLYEALLQMFAEIQEEMTKQGALYRYTYGKESMKYLIRHYFAEAEWRQKKHTPTMDEYMRTAEGTSGCVTLITVSFIGMGNVAMKEAFEWVLSKPDIMNALMILGRLKGDIMAHEYERKRDHIPSAVECYIEQHNVRKQEAVDEFNIRMESTWKDINQAFLKPTQVHVSLLNRVLNFARVMEMLYGRGEWYTHVGPEMQALVKQTLVDSIPLVAS